MYRKTILAILIIFIFTAGCSLKRNIMRKASSGKLTKQSTIGILIEEGLENFAFFMSAAMIDNNYKVKVINPMNIVPKTLKDDVRIESKYSFMHTLTQQIKSGGSLKLKAGEIKTLLDINDMKGTNQRFKDLIKFYERYIEEIAVDYLMIIVSPTGQIVGDESSCRIEIIDIKSRELVFVYYLNANEIYWEEDIPRPKNSSKISISRLSEKSSVANMIKLSEHIARQIK